MAYLIPKDYIVTIQDVNIQQIIQADESIRDRAQLSGEAEAISYLRQKYDISEEFRDIAPFKIDENYYYFDRFYLTANEYNNAATYNTGDSVRYLGNVFQCLINGTTGIDPEPNANWALMGEYNAIYTPKLPCPLFVYNGAYKVGQQVLWKDKIYECKVATTSITHEVALQYGFIQNLPYTNVAPDDDVNGEQYWEFISDYFIVDFYPNSTNYYDKRDPRDAQLVLYICDIVLYHLHSRIAPRNIPELRVKRYEAAIDWLHMCAEGKVTPSMPLIQPKQGNRIRYGGNVKNINNY